MNIMNSLSISPSKNLDIENIKTLILETFDNLVNPWIYSYIVINEDDKYIIKFNINDNPKYNTILLIDAIGDIFKSFNNEPKNNILCFKQPNSNIMIKVYHPFIKNICKRLYNQWKVIEYDDIYQTCILSLLKCIKKNYYIHKQFLIKSFNNEILMLLRKRRGVELISFENYFENHKGNDDNLSSDDYFVDEKDLIDRDNKENQELNKQILQYIKKKYNISDRELEQLLKEYKNKHTNDWSRTRVKNLKAKIEKDNLKRSDFIGGKNG